VARPGDRVLVEQSTYFGFLSLCRAHGVEPVPVPTNGDGLDPAALERALLKDRPRFLYVMPTFHNPTGVSMSETRRRQVLEIAERYGLTIVEDDVFHELSYDGPPPPPLKAMAPGADVAYVDSFSKFLLPGLRLGFLLPPPSLRGALAARLETATLTTPHLLQRTLAEYLRRGELDRHLARVLPEYRNRRDALLAALREHMPDGVRWSHPAGGLCCWLSLPPGGDWDDLGRAAARRNVGYAPGWAFDPERRPVPGLRLCLGAATPERIDAALRVLGELIRERLPDDGAVPAALSGSLPMV
jgi:2-aminoadipate transaminase